VANPVETSTEFNPDTVDNIGQVRDWAKGLKKDVDSYKPAHQFVSESFGSLDNAKFAADFYGSFAGSEFDPDAFYKVLEQLSPQRSKQFIEKFAATQAGELTNKEIEKLFGGKVTQEEIRLFKQFRENGYGLGDGDDIPDALKLDADGNPRSDEEIAFYRNLQKQIKASAAEKAEASTREQEESQAAEAARVAQQVDEFATARLRVLDSEFKTLGLADSETDTADIRAEKSFLREFIINGVTGAFIKDPDGAKDYNSAVEHIKRNEGLLARRYEARIEDQLLKIMRDDKVGRLLKSIATPPAPHEEIPAIPTTGASNTDTINANSGESVYARLVKEGKIQP
jgi:hypothetical protein